MYDDTTLMEKLNKDFEYYGVKGFDEMDATMRRIFARLLRNKYGSDVKQICRICGLDSETVKRFGGWKWFAALQRWSSPQRRIQTGHCHNTGYFRKHELVAVWGILQKHPVKILQDTHLIFGNVFTERKLQTNPKVSCGERSWWITMRWVGRPCRSLRRKVVMDHNAFAADCPAR